MSLTTYKIIHLVGLIILFAAIGSMTLRKPGEKPPKMASILHGIALLLMLVGGFGMLARLGTSWPWPSYIVLKLVVWVVLGALPVLVKKQVLPGILGLAMGAALGGAAAWLAIAKPLLW